MTELGGIGAGLDEDVGDAAIGEVGGAENEGARAVGEDGALVVHAEADLGVGGEVFGDDGEADDLGAVGADFDDLGVVGHGGLGQREGADGADGEDAMGVRAAGDGAVIRSLVGVHKEAAGGGSGSGGFIPEEGGIGFDVHAVDAGDVPGATVVGLDLEGCAEVRTADGEGEGGGDRIAGGWGPCGGEGVGTGLVEGEDERFGGVVRVARKEGQE